MRLSVVQRFAASLAPVAILAGLVVFLAVWQPWLGLTFEPDFQQDQLVISKVAASGPAADSGIRPGSRLIELSADPLEAQDIIDEPDAIETYAAYNDFIDRQARLFSFLSEETVALSVVTSDDAEQRVVLRPSSTRLIGDLPFVFWFQFACAVTISIIAAWVGAIRTRDRAVALFQTAGYSVAFAIGCAAIYSTRELALEGSFFLGLSILNHLSALGFGIAMILLFSTYPQPILQHRWWFWGIPTVFLSWGTANVLQLLPAPALGSHLSVAVEMLLMLALIGVQIFLARRDPVGLRALLWLGLSVALGAGTFILLVAVPNVTGQELRLEQAYAFGFFPLIYLGVAFGLTRYRLFEVDRWAFSVLSYVGAALLFAAVDLLILATLQLGTSLSLGLTALIIALIYLPARNWLMVRLIREREANAFQLFETAPAIALKPSQAERRQAWLKALCDFFQPLHVEEIAPGPDRPRLTADGTGLDLPGYPWSPPVRLVHLFRGLKLAGKTHLHAVDLFVRLILNAEASREAYDKGVRQERRRISRDLHDNVAARLLSSLHSTDATGSQLLVRTALDDIREIAAGLSDVSEPLRHTIAALRVETEERLADLGYDLNWPEGSADESTLTLSAEFHRHFVAIHRELVSNIVKHGQAGDVVVETELCRGRLVHTVCNERDAGGTRTMFENGGHGLTNIAERAYAAGGSFEHRIEETQFVAILNLAVTIEPSRQEIEAVHLLQAVLPVRKARRTSLK